MVLRWNVVLGPGAIALWLFGEKLPVPRVWELLGLFYIVLICLSGALIKIGIIMGSIEVIWDEKSKKSQLYRMLIQQRRLSRKTVGDD